MKNEFIATITRSLTRKGFAWSVALPLSWILLYYAFVVHIRLGLGRWPRFGENLDGRLLRFHHDAVWLSLLIFLGSLCLAPVLLIACLLSSRWRHVSIYVLCYGAGVGVAYWSLYGAPGPFLNWLFD